MGRRKPPDWMLGLLLILGAFLWQRTVFPAWMIDLFPIHLAGYHWRTGQPEWIYAPDQKLRAWHEHTEPEARALGAEGELNYYTYPPFVAVTLSSLTRFSPRVWRNTVLGINVLFLFVISLLILRLCREPFTPRAFLWGVVFLLLSYPIARAAKLAQIVPLLAAFTWWGLLLIRDGKLRSGGAILGIVSAVKLFPAALVVLPAAERKWNTVAVYVACASGIWLASVSLLGSELHPLWWETMSEFGSLVIPFFGNQSVPGWVTRVFYARPATELILFDSTSIVILRLALPVLLASISAVALRRLRGSLLNEALPAAVPLVLAPIFLSVPNAWEHYWVFILPSLAWGIRGVWLKGDARFWDIWLGAAAFLCMMKLTHFAYGASLPERLISGSHCVGLILFYVWLLRFAWRFRREEMVSEVA